MKLEVFQISCRRQILRWPNAIAYAMIRPSSAARNSPLLGSVYNGTTCNGSAMCVAWTTSICQNAFYGQNVQTVGVGLWTRPRNNGKSCYSYFYFVTFASTTLALQVTIYDPIVNANRPMYQELETLNRSVDFVTPLMPSVNIRAVLCYLCCNMHCTIMPALACLVTTFAGLNTSAVRQSGCGGYWCYHQHQQLDAAVCASHWSLARFSDWFENIIVVWLWIIIVGLIVLIGEFSYLSY